MGENAVVPEALNETNYEIWSNCMEIYLLGQDLWEVVEEAEPEDVHEPSENVPSSKTWRRKNALALHAIHMSCGSTTLPKIGRLKSAKEAWDLLRSINISDQRSNHDSDAIDLETDAKEQSEDSPDNDDDNDDVEQSSQLEDVVDYDPFVEATKRGDWRAMKEFLLSHPGATTAQVVDGRTALHHLLTYQINLEIATLLVDETKQGEDFQVLDEESYTSFSRLANLNQPGVLKLLKHMVARNENLPNIGSEYTLPVVVASWKGFKDTTRYLYSVTDKEYLNPEHGRAGVHLLIHCMNMRLFDIALEIVTKFPMILQQDSGDEIYPIYALAKSLSAIKYGSRRKKSRVFKLNHWVSKSLKYVEYVQRRLRKEVIIEVTHEDEKLVYNQARALLRFTCVEVSSFDVVMLRMYVYAAMIEASKSGIVEFVSEMIMANPNLIEAHIQQKGIFWHAVENRQEKVYSLIYSFVGQKDSLLSCWNPEKNNILHMVAKLAPTAVLDRTSGPALQMQRELQWFKEVWSLARLRYREDVNDEDSERLTPTELFTKTHQKLIEAGEKSMKDTAQSSTVVGALIVTVMFAAAFTVPGGNNSDTGLPVFLRRGLFRIFIVSDALSLYSSTTSVLVFLGLLTSRYAENDFYLRLPRKLMIGLVTLFFSITTMMISFCAALALMLDGQLRYILPTVLLAGVPIVIFMSSIVPLLSEIFMSTFGPSIFDKTGKLLEKKEDKKKLTVDLSDVDTNKNIAGEEEETNVERKEMESMEESEHVTSTIDTNMTKEESIVNDQSSVDKIV